MPVGDVVFLSPCSHPLNLFVPAAADHEEGDCGDTANLNVETLSWFELELNSIWDDL